MRNASKIMLAVTLAAAFGVAQANGGGQQSQQPVTNNYGGQGGQGGQGGVAYGGQGGQGGSVLRSGNSANRNTNVNRNSNQQAQGQAQGQIQGQAQGQSSRNTNRNSARQGQAQQANNAGNAQAVSVGGDTYEAARIPAATAYAPNIAPTAVCMGSTSVGGQGLTFGVSVGSSWTDANCMLLEQVRTTSAVLGDQVTAAQMMCALPAYAAARKATGHPCEPEKTAAAYKPAGAPIAQAAQPHSAASQDELAWRAKNNYWGNDPVVLKRLRANFVLANR